MSLMYVLASLPFALYLLLVRKLRVAVEPAWLLYVNAFRCLGAPKGQDMVQSDERLASNSICTVLVMCRMLATFVACMDDMALWQDGATFSTLLHFFPSGQHPVGIELAHFFIIENMIPASIALLTRLRHNKILIRCSNSQL